MRFKNNKNFNISERSSRKTVVLKNSFKISLAQSLTVSNLRNGKLILILSS